MGRNVMKKQKNLEQLLCSKLSVKLPELSQVFIESPSELSGGEDLELHRNTKPDQLSVEKREERKPD